MPGHGKVADDLLESSGLWIELKIVTGHQRLAGVSDESSAHVGEDFPSVINHSPKLIKINSLEGKSRRCGHHDRD